MKIRIGFVSNSSSEAFICPEDMNLSLEQVREILMEMVNAYNKIYGMHNNEEIEEISFDETFDGPKMIDSKDIKLFKDFDYWATPTSKQMVIYSFEDNSIPYGIMEMIESRFNADRIHLG